MDTESFSKTKAMELPRNVVVGHDALHAVGEVCQSLKLGKRALIVADETTMKIAGMTVEKELAARKIRTSEFLIPDATMKEVREGEEKIRKGNIEFALGVGGGRSIDVAKCASFNAGVPFVSVPTAASHDGVVSSRASIQKDGEKVSLAAQTPIAVIMDTGVIAESPFRLLASGCGDIISNLAAVKDWALARNLRNEYYSSYAAALSELAAHLVIENASTIKPRLEESAWFVCKALVSSGVAMSIAGSSRPASGSEHKFSHALDRIAKKPGLHGEQCGVGTIMMMYLHAGNWQEVRDALLAIGAPTTARALGVTDDEVVQALVHAHEGNKERDTILVDQEVEGAQAAMDHAGPDDTPDRIEHPVEELSRFFEDDVLESRRRPFIRAEVSHREAVLDAPRRRRHADPAFPGLAHHLVLVRGPPAHGVLLDRTSAAMRGPIQSVRLDRERRAVVPRQVHVRFLACADQAHDFRRKAGGQDRLHAGPVVRFLEGQLPGVDAPLDAGVQAGAVPHRVSSFGSYWRSQDGLRNAGTPKRSYAAPRAVRETMQDIMP